MYESKKSIEIRTDFEILHKWSECNIQKVNWLKNLHRHKVYVTVQIEVRHNDREIEFFLFKENIDSIIDNLYGNQKLKNVGDKSMEMICDDIFTEVSKLYPGRNINVKAFEDNEVGAVCEYILKGDKNEDNKSAT